jgi:crossover junction endodeoxyribonuclease RuvC
VKILPPAVWHHSLGLDMSTARTGWSVFYDGQLIDHGFLNLEKVKTFEEKCVVAYDFILAKLDQYAIDNLVAEDQFFGKNGKTGKTLMRFSGIAALIAGQRRLPIVFIPPTEIKKVFTGKGNATKDDIRQKVVEIYDLDIVDDNQTDAIAIGYTHYAKESRVA